MVQKAGRPPAETPAVTRLGEEDWRIWREVRLAALADTPAEFAATLEEERTIHEDGWRTIIRDAAIFVATAGGTAVGAIAGLYRESAQERGLGAMWVAPEWRGRGIAALLATAVISWARSEGASTVGLWVSGENARARRFYENQGFRVTGWRRPFPGDSSRIIAEMSLSVTCDL